MKFEEINKIIDRINNIWKLQIHSVKQNIMSIKYFQSWLSWSYKLKYLINIQREVNDLKNLHSATEFQLNEIVEMKIQY